MYDSKYNCMNDCNLVKVIQGLILFNQNGTTVSDLNCVTTILKV